MSGIRSKREDFDDIQRDRYRERRRSRSYSRDRHSRRRGHDSRSRSRGSSSNHRRQSSSRDYRSSRYSSRRYSVSRSRSRSRTRRDSRSSSRSYSRTHRRSRSRTPTKSRRSPIGRQSLSSDREITQSRRQNNVKKEKKEEPSMMQAIKEEAKISCDSSSVDSLPLPPKKEPIGAYYNLDTEEPIDKEKIHREMEEKLRAALAKDGKVYPPPKVEASHPVFANDGSFIEIFKKMQQAMPSVGATNVAINTAETTSTSAAASTSTKTVPPPPMVGRRRGGKILKTGMVAKPKAQGEDNGDPKDFWSLYLREVNKYKNNACDSDGGTRPLVK